MRYTLMTRDLDTDRVLDEEGLTSRQKLLDAFKKRDPHPGEYVEGRDTNTNKILFYKERLNAEQCLDALRRKLSTTLDGSRNQVQTWIDKLTPDTLCWNLPSTPVQTAARIQVIREALVVLDDDTEPDPTKRIAALHRVAYRATMREAQYPSRSTSFMHNETSRDLMASWAWILETVEAIPIPVTTIGWAMLVTPEREG